MSIALTRILYRLYSILLFGVTVLAWSSSNPAEVARFNLPPLGVEEGYGDQSSLTASTVRACEQSKKTTFGFKTDCADDGSGRSVGYTNISYPNQIKHIN